MSRIAWKDAPTRRIELTAIAIILFVLLGFQSVTIHHQSLLMDEVEEITFARGDFWSSVFMPDSMPPLFTLALRSWLSVMSSDETARWFSATCGFLATIVTWRTARQIMSVTPSLVATTFFAFSPLQLYYAQLVRGYALMTLMACLTIGFFFGAIATSRNRYWIGFTISCGLGMYTHYYFVMIPMSLYIAWLALKSWGDAKAIFLSAGLLGLVLLSLIVFLRIDFQYQHDLREPRPLSFSAAAYTYFSFLSGYSLGPSQRELHAGIVNWSEAGTWFSLAAVCMVPLSIGAMRPSENRTLLCYLLFLLTLPLVVIGVVGAWSGITYNVRFVCWMTVPLAFMVGLAVETSPSIDPKSSLINWTNRLSLAGILVLFLFANYQRVYDPRYQIEDIRSAAQRIAQQGSDNDVVFVVSDYMNRPFQYYAGRMASRCWELPKPGERSVVFVDLSIVDQAQEVMIQRTIDQYWLVYSRAFHGDPDGLFLREMQSRGMKLDREYAGVSVFRGMRSDLR